MLNSRIYAITGIILASTLPFSTPGIAEEKTAIADNGREVILKDNGEWQYVTDDVYATTPDGKRIRLQPNQRWSEVKASEAPTFEAPAVISLTNTSAAQAGPSLLALDTAVIEDKRETVGKNKRVRSNLVFYLEAKDDATGLSPDDIKVQDSRGRTYPAFSVSRGSAIVGSGERIIVRAKGAPRWWGVKFFALTIAPNAMSNQSPIELKVPMGDVLRKEVSDLPEDNL